MIEINNVSETHQIWAGQFVRFLFVGIMGVIINFSVLNFLSFIFNSTRGWSVILISAIAFATALVNSFYFNKGWTFKDELGGHGRKFTLFLFISIMAAVINSSIVYSITTHSQPLPGFSPRLWLNFANLLAVGVGGLWNFMGYKFVVFKK